jgi:two-component system cell cycle response regulator CpdR
MARILLAEDDDSIRIFLARALRRAGHEVEAHGSGETALAALADASFDLLVADVVMPGLDGIELARRAGDIWPQLRIVFITGFAAVALRHADVMPSPATVLTKPFHLRELVGEIERLLAA